MQRVYKLNGVSHTHDLLAQRFDELNQPKIVAQSLRDVSDGGIVSHVVDPFLLYLRVQYPLISHIYSRYLIMYYTDLSSVLSSDRSIHCCFL